jgi:hypothetical protein
MRGEKKKQVDLFFVIDVESRIRADHPLRPMKMRVDRILRQLDQDFALDWDSDLLARRISCFLL